MDFFINKGSTLPILKMQVVKDGISDYEEFMALIADSAIYFSMKDANTGAYKILNAKAGFTEKTFVDKNVTKDEYYIFYIQIKTPTLHNYKFQTFVLGNERSRTLCRNVHCRF